MQTEDFLNMPVGTKLIVTGTFDDDLFNPCEFVRVEYGQERRPNGKKWTYVTVLGKNGEEYSCPTPDLIELHEIDPALVEDAKAGLLDVLKDLE